MNAAGRCARAVACALCLHALLTACDRVPEREARPPAELPPTLEPAALVADPPALAMPALPELQRARLAYLFEAGARQARAWPALAGPPPCVVLVATDVQWAVGCQRAPFRAAVQLPAPFLGKPVYARTSADLTIEGLTVPTRTWLARAAASARVAPLVSPATAGELPAEMAVVWVGTLEAIRALHGDFRECTTDEWLSVALHEWMHAWQLLGPAFAPERRAIEDGSLAPDAIHALYAGDARYRDQVQREYRLLEGAVRAEVRPAAARAALRAWTELHRKRAAKLCARPAGSALLHAERVFTYLEGLGRYAESRFLVDPALRPERPLAGDPEFHGFARYASGGYEAMQNRQLDPEYEYAIGFHLALLLDRIDGGWRQRVHLHDGLLLGIAYELSRATPGPASRLRPCR